MALLPPNSGGGSGDGGTNVHGDLVGRDQPNSHPIQAITGLQDWLAQHDSRLDAAEALRYIFAFSNVAQQDIFLPQPLNSISLAIIVVRVSDGAMIEPDVLYKYGTGVEQYIERVRLLFTPPISGDIYVHIIR
jgi:hypothetical protein